MATATPGTRHAGRTSAGVACLAAAFQAFDALFQFFDPFQGAFEPVRQIREPSFRRERPLGRTGRLVRRLYQNGHHGAELTAHDDVRSLPARPASLVDLLAPALQGEVGQGPLRSSSTVPGSAAFASTTSATRPPPSSWSKASTSS